MSLFKFDDQILTQYAAYKARFDAATLVFLKPVDGGIEGNLNAVFVLPQQRHDEPDWLFGRLVSAHSRLQEDFRRARPNLDHRVFSPEGSDPMAAASVVLEFYKWIKDEDTIEEFTEYWLNMCKEFEG
jgi:hypothetical protein